MASQIPRSLLDAYNAKLDVVGDFAQGRVREVLAAWLRTNPDASVAEAREFARVLLQSALELYGAVAEEHAYQLMEDVAQAVGKRGPSADDLWHYEPDDEVIDRTVRLHAGSLASGDRDGFVAGVAKAAGSLSKRAANETMVHQGDVQDRAFARGLRGPIRYARVPQGMNNCPFCIMMASRGFVYLTRDSAGELPGGFNRFHNNCDCRVVPGYDGMSYEGYDPDKLYRRYKACRDTVEHSFSGDWDALGIVGQSRYRSYNDYVEKRIIKEMRTRDITWINGGDAPEVDASAIDVSALNNQQRKTFDKEMKCADALSNNGFRVTLIDDPNVRSARGVPKLDYVIGEGRAEWEAKCPEGGGYLAVSGNVTKADAKFRKLGLPARVVLSNLDSMMSDEQFWNYFEESLDDPQSDYGNVKEILFVFKAGNVIRFTW